MALAAPSMVHRSGNSLVVRSVVSGDALFGTSDDLDDDEKLDVTLTPAPAPSDRSSADEDGILPQCKIKRNYACAKCSYYTQNPRFYLYHLKNVHKEKIKVYECPSCLYASKHSQKLQRHVHMVHVMGAGRRKAAPKPKPIAPKGPGRPPKRKPPVVEQVKVAEPEEKEVEAKSPSFTVEGDNKVFKCSVCPFTSRSQTLVTRHERVVHLKKKFFRCMKCNYVTHMKARYTKHVKYHSMPMIKCDMCDFRTPYKWNLDRHNKNHMGDGAFKCSLCNFTADIKQSLTVHEMNHHVPPVGQAVPSKRRNRVGASDTLVHDQNHNPDKDSDPLEMDEEDSQQEPTFKDSNHADLTSENTTEGSQSPKSNAMMKKPNTFSNFNANELTVKLGEKVINPNDMLQHKNGNLYVKRLKCRICNYRAAWESEMVRHEYRVHNFVEKKKPPPRPIPNLIPIQNKSTQPLSANALKGFRGGLDRPLGKPENPMSEKDLNDICAKSCPNSSLKDFASLIGDPEAFKTTDSEVFNVCTSGGGLAFPVEKKESSHEMCSSPIDFKKTPDSFKKKNASFFDKLKEKLMTGVSESSNLICTFCGYESKCLSESVRHQKLHTGNGNGNNNVCNDHSPVSGTELSSTRCQHCRQRCKTSVDLYVHLQSCVEANKKGSESVYDEREDVQMNDISRQEESLEYFEGNETRSSSEEVKTEPHPMENKVFVWNNIPERGDNERHKREDNSNRKSPAHDAPMVGVETAPGYGAVTSKNKSGSQGHNIPVPKEKRKSDHSLKKVYKCPHCSFWASTASRFHVHIVGHLNKKPFECSLCAYRSNWRWDITKHIRLKTVRDVSHERARVLMTDETGRRNYSKYNKYLTLMRVHEPTAESSGSGRRSKTQPESPPEFLTADRSLSPPSPLPPSQLPAPPKLTPAPASSRQTGGSPSHQLQPPPPLAHLQATYPKPPPLQPSQNAKRSHDEKNPLDEPPKKKSNLENKKTMWKCKKCFFRDSDRAVVLAHVKEHYRNQNNQPKEDDQNEQKGGDNEMYNNNHQNGSNKTGSHSESSDCDNHKQEENEKANDPGEEYKCPSCSFIGDSQDSLTDHIFNHHGDSTDDLFKCFFCPFYVSDKQKLIEHMSMHGLQEVEQFNPKANRTAPKKNCTENGENLPTKRYKCSGCPYVSNSKSQFLYHKQFHRPRGAPFKCTMCSYNVTRRHLLHQHLRVHGINVPTQKIMKEFDDFEDNLVTNSAGIGQIDTSGLSEIPLVWVSKLGNLTKMFKCRYCPHVNIRKSNIQEHEKMHGQRNKAGIEGAASPSHQQQHRCPDCNYVCNNAGVLSSHAKVHQGLFGQVCSLVDNSRSDEAQIKELNTLLGRNEEGPPVITPEEMKKEPKHVNHSSDYNGQSSTEVSDVTPEGDKLLRFCATCPARFLFQKELDIHTRFHSLNLSHRCESCSYTARQRPHLLAHYKVHTDEYQDRTNALCKMYEVSPGHPKPKIAVIVEGPSDVGPAWVVVPPPEFPRTPEEMDDAPCSPSLEDESPGIVQHGNRVVHKQFSCDSCPAQFFKSVALQYHMTLHGGSGRHKCRSCDYAVKTYGNLIKHETVHEQLEPRLKLKPRGKKNDVVVPTSGTELFRQKEAAQKVAATPPPPPPPPPLHIDPEFGVLMHGSPEFIYPTYLKNGRLKEKRYKCHKCPSAFEKREQYKVHLSLHGSKQRYNCERCDYSVKYYANYIQHLRKHQSNDATKAERKLSTDRSSDEHGSEDISESTDAASEDVQGPVIISQRCAKSLQMSMADQQTMMLLQQRVVSNSVSVPEVLNRCPHCPYSNQRRDGVGSHVKCHSNGKTGAFTCKHCNYTVPQQHFLREHNKLHFSPIKGIRPEAYMKCDRLELWSEPINLSNGDKDKVLIFKDKGSNFKGDRFLPQLPFGTSESEEESNEKTFINLKTGEVDNEQEVADDLKEDNKENLSVTSKLENEIVIKTLEVKKDEKAELCETGLLSSNENKGSSDERCLFEAGAKVESDQEAAMDDVCVKGKDAKNHPAGQKGKQDDNSTQDQTFKTQTPSCDSEETTSGLSTSSGDTADESSSSNSCSSTED